MKNFIIILLTTLFATSYLFSANDTSECDKITNVLKKGEKIDCLIALKKKKLLGKNNKENEISKKFKNFENKKKEFDEKNKNLWDVMKNLKK